MNKTAINLHLILSIILSIFGTTACSDKDQMEIMDKVDAIIDEYPDSALTILSAIDPTTLRTREGKARHSLLHSMGIMKSSKKSGFTRTMLDSLFASAYSYYSPLPDSCRETMITHFMAALLGNDEAIRVREFDQAIHHAAGRGKWDYTALAHFNKAVIYRKAFSREDEMESVAQGMEILDKVERLDVALFAHETSGLSYLGAENGKEAATRFNEMLGVAEAVKDSAAIRRSHMYLCASYGMEGKYNEASAQIDSIIPRSQGKSVLPPISLYYYSLSLLKTGRLSEAADMISLMGMSDDLSGKVSYYSMLGKYHAALGNYREAYALSDSITDLSNSIISGKMQFSLPHQEMMLEKGLSQVNRLNAERRTLIFWLIIQIMLMLVICITLFFWYRKRTARLHMDIMRKEIQDSTQQNCQLTKTLEEYIEKGHSLELQLKDIKEKLSRHLEEKHSMEKKLIDKNEKLDSLQREYDSELLRSKTYEKEKNRIIQEYQDMIAYLEKEKKGLLLSTARVESKLYFNKTNSLNARDRFDCSVIVEKYRNQDFMRDLTVSIDTYLDGIIGMIRDNTTINGEGMVLIVLDICGFNYKSISEILNCPASTISSRKTRIKNKISDIQDEEIRGFLIANIPMLIKDKI